jgi:hypothetical protein
MDGIWRIDREARKPGEMAGQEFGNQKARNLTGRLRRPELLFPWDRGRPARLIQCARGNPAATGTRRKRAPDFTIEIVAVKLP